MHINIQQLDRFIVIRFTGSVGHGGWDEIIRDIEEQYRSGEKSIIIDWSKLDAINTSGLQVLVHLIKLQKDDPDFEFFLVTDNPEHLKVLHVFGFDKMVAIHPSEADVLLEGQTIEDSEKA